MLLILALITAQRILMHQGNFFFFFLNRSLILIFMPLVKPLLDSFQCPYISSACKDVGVFSKGSVQLFVTVNKNVYTPGKKCSLNFTFYER